VFAAAALALGVGCVSAAGAASKADPAASPTTVAAPVGKRVIVQWARGSGHAERVAAREDAGVTYNTMLGDPSFQLVVTQRGESATAAAQALEADPAVAVAEPDSLRRVEAVPDDPDFGQEWGLQNTGQTVAGLVGKSGNDVNVVPAWNRTVGTPTTVVADIDTGYRFDSPDLGPVAWTNPGEIPGNGVDDDGDGYIDDVHGWDFVGENSNLAYVGDNDPTDSNLTSGGHGVHTAGTIGAAGNDGTGITGVARNARIMPLRVCTNEPTTNEARCPTSAIIAAINYAGVKGARVANLSLGGTTFNQIEDNAFAEHPGTLYVIAAGNDHANDDSGLAAPEGHHYPCDYKPGSESSPAVPGAIENTICVAALDPGETLASYSDYGATSVDLGAPGTAVLSTYPVTETLFSDNFETNDFATKWTPFGAGFGRAPSGDGPLTSFGLNDTPGAATQANHIYGVKATAGVAVPTGTGACRVEGKRFRKGGGSEGAPYGVIVNGATYLEYFGGETSGAAMASFRTVPILGLGGDSVQPYFEYRTGGSVGADDGLWLDEVALRCNAPITVAPGYSFLEGTSMATPHVSGAATLLFSLDPGATVAQVRQAILSTTTPVTALAGKTTTGGRLNVSAALNQLVPPGTETTAPETSIVSGPAASTTETVAKFHLRRLDADGGTFECKLDTEAFKACAAEPQLTVAVGSHTLQVRAKNEANIVDPSPATFSWTVTGSGGGGEEGGGSGTGTLPPETFKAAEEQVIKANPPAPTEPTPTATCTVPKLAGKTLGQAKAALSAAGCKLGTVSSPTVPRGSKAPKLVVKSSTPTAGSKTMGTVSLKLGAKPKRKHH
jgi:thermitase